MILVYESWKRIISNPLINVISICLGLAFTTIFSFYNSITAVKFSIILLMFVLFFSLILAIIRKDKQNVLEVAKRLNENDKHKYALRILTKAQKKTADDEIKLRIGCSMGSVYCSMGNYQQAIHVLLEALNICDSKWTWEVYYQLIDAFSHKDGYFADKTLDAYLNCIKYRKKYDIYGKENLKLDIQLSHDIYKIYEVWKDYISSNKWFREEMLLRDAACDIVTKNRIKYLSEQASILENKNQAEDALRQYEQAAYLIKKYISVNCFQYAVVQLQMGRLFYRGYEPPRYKLALECFQNAIKIKRKYISDIPEKLSRSFSDAYSNIKELCMISIDDIYDSFNAFAALSASGKKMSDKQFKQLVHLRNEVLYQCQEILPLMEEIYLAESLELADIYYLIGEAYKWNPLRSEDINIGMAYFEKTAKIWRKHGEKTENHVFKVNWQNC